MNTKVKIAWTKDHSLASVQVWTEKLPGRPFPAYAVLCDITANGHLLWNNAEAIDFRKVLIAQLVDEIKK